MCFQLLLGIMMHFSTLYPCFFFWIRALDFQQCTMLSTSTEWLILLLFWTHSSFVCKQPPYNCFSMKFLSRLFIGFGAYHNSINVLCDCSLCVMSTSFATQIGPPWSLFSNSQFGAKTGSLFHFSSWINLLQMLVTFSSTKFLRKKEVLKFFHVHTYWISTKSLRPFFALLF